MFFLAGIPISSETARLWPGTSVIFLQLGRRKFYNIFNKIDQEFPHRECLTVKGLEKNAENSFGSKSNGQKSGN